MLIFPYGTALSLSRPPVITYITTFICIVIFSFQLTLGINFTGSLIYYPDTWNPLKMITASLAHNGFVHIIGNLLFYLAFAPALELLIGSKLRYIWVMLFISFVTGITYSISVSGSDAAPPTLGFSGVVTGMIGLSAFLMPQARIKVFIWYILAWKTFYIKVWLLAVWYIGLDTWTMLSTTDYGGINVVAHVSGGIAGYTYGFFWLRDRREDTAEELNREIKIMEVESRQGKTRAEAYRYKTLMDEWSSQKRVRQDQDEFMSTLYRMVTTHRSSEAGPPHLN